MRIEDGCAGPTVYKYYTNSESLATQVLGLQSWCLLCGKSADLATPLFVVWHSLPR